MWRLKKDMAGGGSLMDMGIYCIQGICYTMGKTPIAVTAKFMQNDYPMVFNVIEQGMNFQMYFDDNVVAECSTSYAENMGDLSAVAEKGWWKLNPAFAYDGIKGETSEGKMDFPNVYEQALQMDAQADSFRKGQKSITPGELGLRDMKIIEAIYKSARSDGKKVNV